MLMIVLRFAHVVAGALWVGMFAFVTFFLMPAFREAGPDARGLDPDPTAQADSTRPRTDPPRSSHCSGVSRRGSSSRPAPRRRP